MHFSEFPQRVGEVVGYGPNIQALSVHPTQGQLVPLARTSELLRDLYRLNISPATICAWIDAAAQRVASSVEAVKESVQAAPVVGADESGLRVDSKLQWLHTAVTPLLTWYGVHTKRGMEAIKELEVLPNCTGRLVHDCFAPYWNLADKEYSLCGAHLLRELAYEQQVSGQSWAQELAATLVDALKACDAAARLAQRLYRRPRSKPSPDTIDPACRRGSHSTRLRQRSKGERGEPNSPAPSICCNG